MQEFLKLLESILQNEALVGAVVLGIGYLWRLWRKDKAEKDGQAFDLAVKLAYDGVSNFAKLYPNQQLDKLTRGLELFRRAYTIERGKAPTAEDIESAKLHFDAIHSQEAKTKQLPALTAVDKPQETAAVPQMPLGLGL